MKKNNTIVISILLVLLIVVNILLYFTTVSSREIEQENFSLKEKMGNILELSQMIEMLNEENLAQSYKPIIMTPQTKQIILPLLSSGNKLFVRFSLHSCPPCINGLKAFIKDLGRTIGFEHIVLLPLGDNKTMRVFKQEMRQFRTIELSNDALYASGTDESSEPYFFISQKNDSYPLLFFFFRSEFTDLNKRYYNGIVKFFDYQKQKL